MQETDYYNYDLGDFAADEYFVEWVLRPDLQSDAFWARWQADHAGKEKELHEARLLVLLMHSRKMRMQDSQKENLWQKIQSQTIEQQLHKPTNSIWLRYAVAACVALFVVVTGGILYRMFKPTANQLVVVENAPGKTSVLYLEDGTKVWLNAASKLSYGKSFEGKQSRTVSLEGEAFFDVAEDKRKPFIVNAGLMRIRVLGTAFNVKAYTDDDEVKTVLVRGRVEATSVTHNNASIVLSPNQQATLDIKSNRMTKNIVAADDVAAWRDGVLIFDNTPFAQVKRSLERRYGVTILLDDQQSLACHFSGVVRDEPLTKVLDLLQKTSSMTYEIKGTVIRLNGSLCQGGSAPM